MIDQSEIIGRGLILFVLFASSMNWWHYREIRMNLEKEKETKIQKDKNKVHSDRD